MSALFLSLALACALGTTMLAAGTRIGRQRTMGELSQLLERGTFRLLSAEGKPVSVGELSDALRAVPPSPAVAPSKLIALALTVASVSGVLAYFIVRSAH